MKLVSLISGGIDSPVSTYLMIARGADVISVHCDNRPFTDETFMTRTKDAVQRIATHTGRELELVIVPNGDVQADIARNSERRYQCVLCRKRMLLTASKLARKIGAEGLITGESLGQVASQTLRNLMTETAAHDLPILRPLIGMDKEEIITIAKEIGTYDISIRPGTCCTLVPNRPATMARTDSIQENEENLDEALIDTAIERSETHVFGP